MFPYPSALLIAHTYNAISTVTITTFKTIFLIPLMKYRGSIMQINKSLQYYLLSSFSEYYWTLYQLY